METKKKVLIVDDSSLFRKYTRSILEKHYELELVDIGSVSEFNNYLANCPAAEIALILLDLNLPDGNGLIALKKYKEKYGVADLPYLVVSAGVSKDIVPLALKYGARDIMAKPFKPEELINRIEQIFSGKPLHRLHAVTKTVWDYKEPIGLELKRAERGSYPFSILRLKFPVSQTENDLMQKRFSDLLQSLLRETDTIVELSENDYLFLLPFTSHENIPAVKQKIEKKLLPGNEDNPIICALSCFPEHAKNTDALIENLDTSFKLQQSNC